MVDFSERELDGLLHELGGAFDAPASPQPGDHARFQRQASRAARASRRVLGAPTVKVGIVALAFAAGVLGAKASESGSLLAASSTPAQEPSAGSSWDAEEVVVGLGAEAQVPVEAEVEVEAEAEVEAANTQFPTSTEAEERRHVKPKPSPQAKASPALSPASAAELLRRATQARRSGEAAKAVALYERLVAEFPDSREAALSLVARGKLELSRKRPGAARLAFERYLDEQPEGVLAPEARVGVAESHALDGDPSKERAAWQAVVDHHPRSVYVGKARARLEALP